MLDEEEEIEYPDPLEDDELDLEFGDEDDEDEELD